MKFSKNNLPVLALLSILMVTGCKEETVAPPLAEVTYNYPLTQGEKFYYRIDTVSESGAAGQTGTRVITNGSSVVYYNTPYVNRRDSVILDGLLTVSDLYMRKTNAGVYIYVDTSALAAMIPDSLRRLIDIDNEIIFISYPLESPRFWPAYKVLVDLVVQSISFVDFNGSYLFTESLALNLNGQDTTIIAKKIQYDLTLSVPDSEGEISKTSYRAFGWFANGLGMVRMQGSNTILSLFSGGTITGLSAEGESRETMTGYGF